LEFAGKHRFTLGGEGLRIRNLIHEGRKY
jgi:hypothetical protein